MNKCKQHAVARETARNQSKSEPSLVTIQPGHCLARGPGFGVRSTDPIFASLRV